MNHKYQPGMSPVLFFQPTAEGMEPGAVTVLRALDDTERDEEVGPMYKVRYSDGTTATAFEDELSIEKKEN